MVSVVGVGLAILAAVCLASQALTIRFATRNGRSNDVLLVVMIVNVVVFVPLTILLTPSPTITVTSTSLVAFIGAGIVGTMLGRAFFYAGIKQIGASRAEPIKASMPLHATILAVILLSEQVYSIQWIGIIFIVIGIALVSWEGSNADRIAGRKTPWFGLSLPLAAAFFFGLEPILASVGLNEGTPVIVGLTIKTISALLIFVIYLSWRHSLPTRATLSGGDFGWYIAAGLSSTGFLLAYYAALDVSRVSVVVPIMQTSPLIVVIISAAFLHKVERVTPQLVLAVAIIVTGGILVTFSG